MKKTTVLTTAICLLSLGAMPDDRAGTGEGGSSPPGSSLEETRLTMGKWIETQQIISKEREDWRQGKDILLARLELVKQEVASLSEKIAQARSRAAEAEQKRAELLGENQDLEAMGAQLTEAATAMETEIRRLYATLPVPIVTTLQPLYGRIPEDPADTRASVAERFQNVLGILNELNKANNEISVGYEIRNMADGKPAEVRVLYVGLAQAYYVSARGEGGVGRPGSDGWTWEPSRAVASDVHMALEIHQGKHTPAFVPLPVKLQ